MPGIGLEIYQAAMAVAYAGSAVKLKLERIAVGITTAANARKRV